MSIVLNEVKTKYRLTWNLFERFIYDREIESILPP